MVVLKCLKTAGTGYDIANRNIANPDSFRHAIYLAIDILKNRNTDADF